MSECLGTEVDTFFIANWPIAHARSDLEKRMEYFMKAQLLSGKPSLIRSEDEDHAWVTKDQLSKYLLQEKQLEVLSKALP